MVVISAQTAVRTYSHLIRGRQRAAPVEFIERRSPATGELVAQFANGTPEDARVAASAARRGFDEGAWRRMPGVERGRVLHRWAELIRRDRQRLAVIEVQEVGKPYTTAWAELGVVADMTEWSGALAGQLHGEAINTLGDAYTAMIYREPVGVVLAIIPWNCPAILYAQKVPFALGAGCSVVVKPSELTSGTAIELSLLALEAGLPPGVLHVVTGTGPTVGQVLVEHPDVDMISFTGSTRTARAIEAAPGAALKRKSFELGGKGATIVFADADLDDAVDGALFGVFANQGESCCAGTRLLVEDTIADAFLWRVAERASRLRVGDPFDDRTNIGALIHHDHMERVLSYIAAGRAQGAEVLVGGDRVTDGELERGCFVAPTIFDRVTPENIIFRDEIFGPVLSAMRFADLDEALRLANLTSYGLGDSVWTQSLDTAHVCARELRSGTVWVNTTTDGAVQLPFGGFGLSGHGREKGLGALLEFTEQKTVQIHLGRRAPAYPAAAVNGRGDK
jgi:betaine-aldehyde dehydrogenase